MVGNAEPGKEYNYRPLSKLCECQLDVNDQVSTKGLGREGSEREGELISNGEQETAGRKERDISDRPPQTLLERKRGALGAGQFLTHSSSRPVLRVPRCGS